MNPEQGKRTGCKGIYAPRTPPREVNRQMCVQDLQDELRATRVAARLMNQFERMDKLERRLKKKE